MSQQLVKKGTNGKHENVMPRSWIEAIKDKNTGQTLVEILQGFNMYFLPYNGNTSTTRCLVPTMLRKKGLWITYVKYDGNVYTEWYAADEIDDKSWGDSSNWRIGNNTLVGDITISANGNWVINGVETKFKAVGEKGNTPLLRVANNRLQVSYDLGNTYRDVTNNPVYTKFRWLATSGDTQANNVGRIQASTDEGKTWANMSNDFTNNLHIKKYIGVNESLPTSGIAEGTIYAKGPYYAEDDTLNDNPIYRLWVYAWKGNTLAWQDNGEFQSIAAGVVQETGNSETKVMSQKAVSEKLTELGSNQRNVISVKNGYLDVGDGYKVVVSNNNNRVYCSQFFRIEPNTKYFFKGIGNLKTTVYYYNEEKEFIKYHSYFTKIDTLGIVDGASFVRFAFENPDTMMTEGTFDYDISFDTVSSPTMLTDITYSDVDNELFVVSDNVLFLNSTIYVYRIGEKRLSIPAQSISLDFNSGTRFLCYDTNNSNLIVVSPGDLYLYPTYLLIGIIVKRSSGVCNVYTNGNIGNNDNFNKLSLPVITHNGDIIISNNSINFTATAYYYYRDGRSAFTGSFDLTVNDAISRIVLDKKNKTIKNVATSAAQDETSNITIGFIVRDQTGGNVVDCIMQTAQSKFVFLNKPSSLSTYSEVSNIYNPSKIKYIPHRGVRNSEIPENTTYSVMFAALYGLKYSECDVRYTSDGVGVVMHDTTINRTMYNSDLSAISGDVAVAGSTYEALSQYVYKSTNPLYRTKIQTIREYIDACAQWDICPIIQGSMSSEDLRYCYNRLGDNWICYTGDYTAIRAISNNILYLTSTNYGTVEEHINALKQIGGKVGVSKLDNAELTDDLISACKSNGFEVMASYAYQHQNIPDAIRRGATIVLSDNVGKDTNQILVSSINGWEKFTHNGVISNGKLTWDSSGWLNYILKQKGNYKIYAQFSGEGTITLPDYTDTGVYGSKVFPMANGLFLYTFLYLEDNDYNISLDTTSGLTLERLIIFHEGL